MKLVGRILIILLAAAIIAGLAVVAVDAGALNGGGPGGGGEFERGAWLESRVESPQGFIESAEFGAGRGDGDRHEAGIGVGTAVELLKNLVVIGGIIAGVSLMTVAGAKLVRRDRKETKEEKFNLENDGSDE